MSKKREREEEGVSINPTMPTKALELYTTVMNRVDARASVQFEEMMGSVVTKKDRTVKYPGAAW